MFTRKFWKAAAERAVKSAGQAELIYFGGGLMTIWGVDWKAAAGVGLAGALLSALTSLASTRVGDDDSPSLVDGDR